MVLLFSAVIIFSNQSRINANNARTAEAASTFAILQQGTAQAITTFAVAQRAAAEASSE
jgi:hypothetical protein